MKGTEMVVNGRNITQNESRADKNKTISRFCFCLKDHDISPEENARKTSVLLFV